MKITKSYLKEQVLALLEREEEETSVYYVDLPKGNFNSEVQDEFKKLTYRSRDLHDQVEMEYRILKTVMEELNIPERNEGVDPKQMRRYLFVRGYNKKDEARIAKIVRERYFNDPSIKFIKLEWETPAMKEARETLSLYSSETEHEYINKPGSPSHGMPRAGGTLLGQYYTFTKGLPKKPEGMKEMKITKNYLKQIIKEEIGRISEEQSGDRGPDISHVKRGLLSRHPEPDLQPIFITKMEDQNGTPMYVYKLARRGGSDAPAPQYNMIAAFPATEIDSKKEYASEKNSAFFGGSMNQTEQEAIERIKKGLQGSNYISPKSKRVGRQMNVGPSGEIWRGY